MIFTSGSTGRAKGVMVTHSSLENAALGWDELYRLRQPPLRHLQAAAFSFDVFTGDWIRALTTGGTLVACPRESLLDPAALVALIRREQSGVMELVPVVAEVLADELERQGEKLESVRILAVGSDTVGHRLYQRLARLVGARGRVVNSYGLTEATIDSTCYEGLLGAGYGDGDADSRVPIGLPLAGTRAYVLDKRMEPVPMSVVGELFIGGNGVARGYANDASRTAERFLPDPCEETGGARLYRTGDLARWRPESNLEHLGRVDRQIKIRGVRIEPAEIEAALGRHPSVSQAVIAVRHSGRRRRILAAYVVRAADAATGDGAACEPSALELRGWLRERLPEPMVPATILFVETLPLLPSGKIDHAALATLDAGNETLETNHLPPRTAADSILTGITAELLERDEIGIEEDFFELGIDSILGIQLIARARMAGLRLSPAQLFRHPTIAMLARVVEQEPTGEHSPAGSFLSASPFELAPGETDLAALEAEMASQGGVDDVYPLTPVQEGMLFHTFTDPEAGLYVEEFRCQLQGTLKLDFFREAWRRLVARHPVLRTAFRWTRAGRPYQVVHRAAEPPIDFHDLRDLAAARQRAQIESDLQKTRRSGLNVAVPPIMGLGLYQTGDQTHEFIWHIHHVIVDGWCLSILLGEVLDLYEGLLQGLEPTLAPSRPFRDYIAWLLRQDFSAAEVYWRESLRGITAPTPLGLDRRQTQPTGDSLELFQEREALLSPELTERLRSLARTSQVTLSTLIQGAWALLLSRYSGQRDVVFGIAVSGRPPELPGIESMVGLFINTLPLRVTIVEEASLIPWLKKLQADAVEVRRHEAIPLPQIAAWSEIAPGRPLFDSVVIFQNLPFVESLGLRARRLGIEAPRYRERTHYSLALTAVPGAGLTLRINIDARCFDIGQCERMLAHFVNLLEAIASDADRRLLDLPLVSMAEQEQLLGQWSHPELFAPEPGQDVDRLSEEELDAFLRWAQSQGENHEPSR